MKTENRTNLVFSAAKMTIKSITNFSTQKLNHTVECKKKTTKTPAGEMSKTLSLQT